MIDFLFNQKRRVSDLPSWVKDEDKWEKAKEVVKKEYGLSEDDGDHFWALVAGVYKRMKGRIKSRLKKR